MSTIPSFPVNEMHANLGVQGTTYPLDLVRSRLSIATASVSFSTALVTAAKPSPSPVISIPLQQPAKHALASAYHTSSSLASDNISSTLSAAYTKSDLTTLGMIKKIMREEGGLRALYRGMMTTAVGVAPYVGINFAAYEFFRGIITPPGKTQVWRKLSCGALAGENSLMCWIEETILIIFFGFCFPGSISQTLTYPFDVLRRKMQVTG